MKRRGFLKMLGLGGAAAVAAPVVAKAVEPPVPKTIGISPPVTMVPGSMVDGWYEAVETGWQRVENTKKLVRGEWQGGNLPDVEVVPPYHPSVYVFRTHKRLDLGQLVTHGTRGYLSLVDEVDGHSPLGIVSKVVDDSTVWVKWLSPND